MTKQATEPLDFSGLKTYSVYDRHSKVTVDDFARPVQPGMTVRDGMDVIMGLRTEDLIVDDGQSDLPGEWKIEGVVDVVEPLGSETNIHMNFKSVEMVAKCEGRRQIKVGDTFKLALNLEHLHIFDAETTQAIY